MGSKLDDAQVARLKADAQRLSQSGFKVDLKVDNKEDKKSDVKVNAKELPESNVIVK